MGGGGGYNVIGCREIHVKLLNQCVGYLLSLIHISMCIRDRNNYVQKILTGEIAFHQISGPVAEAFSLHFPADRVCVLLLSPETSQESGFSSEPSPADNTEQLVYFIIENVLKELLSGQFPDNYFCIQHRQIAVITCIPGEAAQPEQSLELSLIHI